MSTQPDQLSQLLLEADGLILLLHRHRDETPIDAINLLRRKLQLIIALTDGLDEIEEYAPADHVEHSTEKSDETPQEWIEDTVDSADDVQPVEYDAVPEIDSKHEDVDTQIASQTEENSFNNVQAQTNLAVEPDIIQPQYSEDNTQNTMTDTGYYRENPLTDDAQKVPDHEDSSLQDNNETDIQTYIEDTIEQGPVTFSDTISDQPIMYEPVDKPVILEDDVVFMNDSPKTESPNTVVPGTESSKNELPRRVEHSFIENAPIYKPRLNHLDEINTQPSTEYNAGAPKRPVSSVFNLNDKFRFRRELFGNSDAQYVDCLDILSAMTSIDEAKEYLYEDLSWDPENEDVKAFVELISNYYKY